LCVKYVIALVRVAGKGLKAAGFSVSCGWPARVARKRVNVGQLTVESLKLNERGKEERRLAAENSQSIDASGFVADFVGVFPNTEGTEKK
jgi:hypothetical protein